MPTAAELYGLYRNAYSEIASKPGLQRFLSKLANQTGSAWTGSGSILWAPGGGGDAVTWAEVMAIVTASSAPVEIYCRPVAPGVPLQIPPGTYDMHWSSFLGERLGGVSAEVNLQTAACCTIYMEYRTRSSSSVTPPRLRVSPSTRFRDQLF